MNAGDLEMNETAIRKLEFDHVRRQLARCCSCALGRGLAQTLRPSNDAAMVERWLEQARAMARAASAHGPPPLAGVHDVRDAVRATATPTPLEARSLADVAETLAATGPLRAWFDKAAACEPMLAALGGRIADFTHVAERISESISARGEVMDHASPRLRTIRATIDAAKDRINVVFDRLLKQSSVTKFLQFHGTTFHNDRVVMPLKSEYRGRVPGIIHRSSDSGATLFVEPSEVVELNNSIIRLRQQEHTEITRILSELSRLVHVEAVEVLKTLQAMAVVDLNRAKWALMKHYDGVIPQIDPDGRLELHAARHAVLFDIFAESNAARGESRCVVPIDVRLRDDFDALIITGPNTGGKTVALKTIGLTSLMAQAGLPIPAAEGSRLPVYAQVFVDIGDEQSLQQSLSTFSSHMSNLLEIVQRSGPGTLAIIDELGAGTDPDEGAAIGRAVVEELLHRGAAVVVSTHLSSLKAMAFTHPRVDNASVEFDVKTLRPLYRLRLGEPGNSNAITIARRLGMPARLVHAAQRHLEGRYKALNEAIKGTLQSRREAERARKAAHQAALESQRLREEYELKQMELDEERAAHQRWTQWVTHLRPGDDVYVKPIKSAGRIVRLALQKQTAVVTVGALEYELPLAEIVERK